MYFVFWHAYFGITRADFLCVIFHLEAALEGYLGEDYCARVWDANIITNNMILNNDNLL